MPRRRYNNTVLDNPYVGVDVDYFDRKALQKQQRHDDARSAYSKFSQNVADQSFLDRDAKNTYLEQQQANFDEVLNKHAGNLSSGYQDIMGAIEKSKFSPYHNLNRRQVEQAKIQQKLATQYGDKAIDLSNINQPLYQRDKEGNVTWSDPSQIQANVIEANDYSKIVEDMLSETAAQNFTTQTGLGGGAGNPFYLMSRITKGEVLSPQELQRIAMDPNVQQAFLANASTAGIDNRQVPGTEMTYKDMLTNPQALGQFIYGNIQDKQKNNIHEMKQFKQNVGAVESTRHRNRLKQIAQEKMVIAEPSLTANFGVQKHNTESINRMNLHKKDLQQNLQGLQKETSDISRDMFGKLGLSFKEGNETEGIGTISNPDGTLNKKLVTQRLIMSGVDPKNSELLNMVNEIDDQYRTVVDNLDLRGKVEQSINDYDLQEEGLNQVLYKDYYKGLSSSKQAKLKELGINNEKDFLNNIGTLERNLDLLAKKRAGYLTDLGDYKSKIKEDDFLEYNAILTPGINSKHDRLAKGLEVENVSKVRFNQDKNSQDYKFGQDYVKLFEDWSPEKILANFTDKQGNSLGLFNPDAKAFLESYDRTKPVKMVKAYKPSTTLGSEGAEVSFILEGQDEEGNKIPLYINEAKDVNQSNFTTHSERLNRRIANNAATWDFSRERDYKNMVEDVTDYGALHYGNDINAGSNFLRNISKGRRDVTVSTDAGDKKLRMMTYTNSTGKKYAVGFVNPDGSVDQDNIVKVKDFDELNMMSKYLSGATGVAENERIDLGKDLIQKGTYVLKSKK